MTRTTARGAVSSSPFSTPRRSCGLYTSRSPVLLRPRHRPRFRRRLPRRHPRQRTASRSCGG
eukprot:358672-Chlamydomonas_euryale.AAC.10